MAERRKYECLSPDGKTRRNAYATLPGTAKPAAAWFRSLDKSWVFIGIYDSKDHPTWMDLAYTFVPATEFSA